MRPALVRASEYAQKLNPLRFERDPGDSNRPTARIPTNADDQKTTVMMAAITASRCLRGGTCWSRPTAGSGAITAAMLPLDTSSSASPFAGVVASMT
jgi:hypothetical protein